jgi:hypothetical protein
MSREQDPALPQLSFPECGFFDNSGNASAVGGPYDSSCGMILDARGYEPADTPYQSSQEVTRIYLIMD